MARTRRRVLVLNQFALPRSAPGGTRHVELFEKLEGWEPTVLAGRRGLLDQSRIVAEGCLRTVPVTAYRGNGLSRIINWASYSATALVRGMVRRPVDVVYGSSPHLGAALAGFLIAKAHRARFVLEVRDLWPQILADSGMMAETALPYRLLKVLERFLYRKADTIVVLAQGSIDAIVAEGIPESKIEFIPNGADPSDFEVMLGRDELRYEFGLAGTVVVYAGAHGPANGLDLVLDAAEQLQDHDITFVLVGDGVCKADLIADAKRRGLDNIDFRDPISKAKIPELFAAADIGLHCLADIPLFRHGVSPNKLYDYMAAGLPVVTNTPGEVAAMVDDAQSGEAVGPQEIADGVHYIQGLSRSARLKLGESGRDWMAENRSRRALARRLNDSLNELVDERNGEVNSNLTETRGRLLRWSPRPPQPVTSPDLLDRDVDTPFLQLAPQRASLAIDFLVRSIEACQGQGSSAYFSRTYHPRSGWQAAYPETTGYIIPTLFRSADRFDRPELNSMGAAQAEWIAGLADGNGALPGGFHSPTKERAASAFNTGQMILGLVAAADRTGSGEYMDAAIEAARWLASSVDPQDGRITSFAYEAGYSPDYYTRVAWPMLEVGLRVDDRSLVEPARTMLDTICDGQREDGAFPRWGFKPGDPAFTHTIAYTIRGLLESGALLGPAGDRYTEAAHVTANRLLRKLEFAGGLAGAYRDGWEPISWYTCLTGNCQMAIIWLKMASELDDMRYASAALKALDPPVRAQATSRLSGASRGSIPGSAPIFGRYLFMRRPNWAAKFFVDAMLDAEEALVDTANLIKPIEWAA